MSGRPAPEKSRGWDGFKIGPESNLTQEQCNALWRDGLVGRVTETVKAKHVAMTREEDLAKRRAKYQNDPVYRAERLAKMRAKRKAEREINGKNK